ncbi:hypothetical protein Tco_0606546 [Tanacetum coccineum]
MVDKYCPRNEMKKLEAELWNLKVKGASCTTMACTVKCGNYKKVGHMTRDCRNPFAAKNQSNPNFLDRSMDSDKYLEGKSMQRPPLFESDSFIYWKNRFETYVKSKDLDLGHVITNGDFQPIVQNLKTKLDEVIPFGKQTNDLKKRLAKNNEAKMVIYKALPRKEYERIDNNLEESRHLEQVQEQVH